MSYQMYMNHRSLLDLIALSAFSIALCVSGRGEAQQLYERSRVEDPLVIHKLYINAHKSSGWPWDSKPLGAPDPYIKVYLNGDLAWTSRTWRDELQPISKPLTTSAYRRKRARPNDLSPAQIEIWDKDVLQDDLIASFMISRAQLNSMRSTPLTLSSDAVLIELAWRSAPKRLALKRSAQSEATRAKEGEPKATKPEVPASSRLKLTQPLSQRPLGSCEVIPPSPELSVEFKLKTSPREIFQRGQALIEAKRARIERYNVTVRPCREGYDVSSKFGLGQGWIRLSDHTVTVMVDRPKLMRAFPSTQSVRRRVIRNMCRRILKKRSPQCR